MSSINIHEELQLLFLANIDTTLGTDVEEQLVQLINKSATKPNSSQILFAWDAALLGRSKIFCRDHGDLIAQLLVSTTPNLKSLIPKQSLMKATRDTSIFSQIRAYTRFAERCPKGFMDFMRLMCRDLPMANKHDGKPFDMFIIDKGVSDPTMDIADEDFEDRCHELGNDGTVNLLMYDAERDNHIATYDANGIWEPECFAVVDKNENFLAAFHYECLKFFFMPLPITITAGSLNKDGLERTSEQIDKVLKAADVLKNATWDSLRKLPEFNALQGGSRHRKSKTKPRKARQKARVLSCANISTDYINIKGGFNGGEKLYELLELFNTITQGFTAPYRNSDTCIQLFQNFFNTLMPVNLQTMPALKATIHDEPKTLLPPQGRELIAYTMFAERFPRQFMMIIKSCCYDMLAPLESKLVFASTKHFIINKDLREKSEYVNNKYNIEQAELEMGYTETVELIEYDPKKDAVMGQPFWFAVVTNDQVSAVYHYECLKYFFMRAPAKHHLQNTEAWGPLQNATFDQIRRVSLSTQHGGLLMQNLKYQKHPHHMRTNEKHIDKYNIERTVYVKGNAKYVRKKSNTTGTFKYFKVY